MRTLLALVFGAASLAACDEITTATSGDVAFRYHQDFTLVTVPFIRSPIGKGLSVDVAILTTDNYSPLAVKSMEIRPTEILEGTLKSEHIIRLKGLAAGESTLEVDTAAGSGSHVFTVKEIAKTQLTGLGVLVGTSDRTSFVEDSEIDVFAENLSSSNERLAGDGAATLPPLKGLDSGEVLSQPAEVISGVARYEVASPGQVSLEIRGQPVTFDVIAQEDVKSLRWLNDTSDGSHKQKLIFLWGFDIDERRVAGVASKADINADAFSSVCQIKPYPAAGEGAWLVTPIGPGHCNVQATMGELTTSASFTFSD